MEAVLTQIMASAVVGVLSWIGGQLFSHVKLADVWNGRARPRQRPLEPGAPLPQPYAMQGPYAAPAPYGPQPGAGYYGQPPYAPAPIQTSTRGINLGLVLKQIAILQFVANVAGAIVGLIIGLSATVLGVPGDTALAMFYIVVLLVGTVIEIAAFYLFGRRIDPAVMWGHLTYVAVGTVILTLLVNALLSQTPPGVAAVFVACFQTFLAMGIGGAIARTSASRGQVSRAPQAMHSQYAPYPAMPPYGYPYGAQPPQPQYPVPGAYPPPPNYQAQVGAVPAYPPYGPGYPPPANAPSPQQPGSAAHSGEGQRQPQPVYPVQHQPPSGQSGGDGAR